MLRKKFSPVCRPVPQAPIPSVELTMPPVTKMKYRNLMWDPHVRRGFYEPGKAPKIQKGRDYYDDPKAHLILPQKKAHQAQIPLRCLEPEKWKGVISFGYDGGKYFKPYVMPPNMNSIECQTTPLCVTLYDDRTDNHKEIQTMKLTEMDVEEHEKDDVLNVSGATMVDNETQLSVGEIPKFEELPPISKSLVNAVIQRALLELMEEHELDCLLAQQQIFESARMRDLSYLHQMRDHERKAILDKINKANTQGTYEDYLDFLWQTTPSTEVGGDALPDPDDIEDNKNLQRMFCEEYLNPIVEAAAKDKAVANAVLDDVLETIRLQVAVYEFYKSCFDTARTGVYGPLVEECGPQHRPPPPPEPEPEPEPEPYLEEDEGEEEETVGILLPQTSSSSYTHVTYTKSVDFGMQADFESDDDDFDDDDDYL